MAHYHTEGTGIKNNKTQKVSGAQEAVSCGEAENIALEKFKAEGYSDVEILLIEKW